MHPLGVLDALPGCHHHISIGAMGLRRPKCPKSTTKRQSPQSEMAQKKTLITLESGESTEAVAPVVVSASRSTDIPAFYADWFFERLEKGYSAWTNPFNGATSYVSYADTRFIVFWSKNPKPLLRHIGKLEERDIGCYVQYTLNDYEAEGLERNVPPLEERLETFRLLVGRLGKGRVVWRFDPMLLTESLGIGELLEKVRRLGDSLKGLTERMVFSFADISSYRKVRANLERSGIRYREWDEPSMELFASRLAAMNRERGWNYELATCAEKIDISRFGIQHNRCVDDDLIIRFGWKDKLLMDHLKVAIRRLPATAPSLFEEFGAQPAVPEGALIVEPGVYALKRRNNKDKGQRLFCGCVASKDIGQYDTCPHMCEYCYANSSHASAAANWRRHLANPHGERITGK